MKELLDIDRLYSTIFRDLESFHKYYIKELTGKTYIQWGKKLNSDLHIINEYLKPTLVGIISVEQVRLWIDRVRDWNEKVNIIKHRINDDILKYQANQDNLPEGYFPSELIQHEVVQSGKSYDVICELFKTQIEAHINIVNKTKAYINESASVTDLAFYEMKNRFKVILFPNSNNNSKSEYSDKSKEHKTEVIKTRATADKLPAFETTSANQKRISAIFKKLASGKSPFITNSEEDFRLVFTGPQCPNVIIDWHRGKNELHYFIDNLYSKEIIYGSDTKRWEKTACYFTVCGNSISSEKLKGANRFKNKSKRKEIDSLFL